MNIQTITYTLALLTLGLTSCKEDNLTSNPDGEEQFSGCRISDWAYSFDLNSLNYNSKNQLASFTTDDKWLTEIIRDANGRITSIDEYYQGELEWQRLWSYDGNSTLPNKIQDVDRQNGNTTERGYSEYTYKDDKPATVTVYPNIDGSNIPTGRTVYTYLGTKLFEVTVNIYDNDIDRYIFQSRSSEFKYDTNPNPFSDLFWFYYYSTYSMLPMQNNIVSNRDNGTDWEYEYTYNSNGLPETITYFADGRDEGSSTFSYYCQ